MCLWFQHSIEESILNGLSAYIKQRIIQLCSMEKKISFLGGELTSNFIITAFDFDRNLLFDNLSQNFFLSYIFCRLVIIYLTETWRITVIPVNLYQLTVNLVMVLVLCKR